MEDVNKTVWTVSVASDAHATVDTPYIAMEEVVLVRISTN